MKAVKKRFESVWDAIEDTPGEAEAMKVRAQLLRAVQAWGISDNAVEQNIKAGNTGALSTAAYWGKVFLYNGLNFFSTGFVGRQGERYEAASQLNPGEANYNNQLGAVSAGNVKHQRVISSFKDLSALSEIEIKVLIASKRLDPDPGCFAADTLVHTINGLVRIEQIKAGDLVLSQPEACGELSYKPVTQIFEHDYRDVMLLPFGLLEGPRSLHTTNIYYRRDVQEVVGRGKGVLGSREYILATPNHPFFTRPEPGHRFSQTDPNPAPKWMELDQIQPSDEIEALNGTTATVGDWGKFMHETEDVEVGFVHYDDAERWKGGHFVKPGTEPLELTHVQYTPLVVSKTPRMGITVYNLEVQDNHTYYVGRAGLWVHDNPAIRENQIKIE